MPILSTKCAIKNPSILLRFRLFCLFFDISASVRSSAFVAPDYAKNSSAQATPADMQTLCMGTASKRCVTYGSSLMRWLTVLVSSR